MQRRDFITLLGGAAAAWPLAARAQGERLRRVAVLFGTAENDPKSQRYVMLLRQELGRLGWTEGRNLQIDFRFAVQLAPSQTAIAELVRLAPDVIYVWGGSPSRAARQQTKTIPIVFVGPSTTVADVNVARPQGNITGFPFLHPSIAGKWVELLKEADPRVGRVAVVVGPDISPDSGYLPFIREAAATLDVNVSMIKLTSAAR
jgi:putative ABC transport system substrate-binding protein